MYKAAPIEMQVSVLLWMWILRAFLVLAMLGALDMPVSAQNTGAPGGVAPPPEMSRFPASPYRGRITSPNFVRRDKEYAMYRTRLLKALKAGPNFAGHLVLEQIGCGAGCRFAFVIDARNGKVSEFPLGGENNLQLTLKFEVGSRLIVATWEDERCRRASYEWTGDAFRLVEEAALGRPDACRQ